MTTAPDPTPPVRLGVLRERAPEPAQPPGPLPTSQPIRRPTRMPSLSPERVAELRAEHAAGVLHIGAIARKHGIGVALTMHAIFGRGAYRDVGRDEPGGAA